MLPDPGDHTTAGGVAGRIAIILALVALNALFVAAEFALVASRRNQIDVMADQGDRGARVVQRALTQIDRYLSATQLGITLTSLGLGWVGEPAIAAIIDALLRSVGVVLPEGVTHGAALLITGFVLIVFLHVVFGEMAPKSVALVNPEGVSKAVIRPLMVFSAVMSPFLWLANWSADAVVRLFGIAPTSRRRQVHSPEELRLLVMHAHAHGALSEPDSAMLAGVFDFRQKKAHDVMRPRTDVVALDVEATEDEVWRTLRTERYSRYPVYRESLDDVVGVFLAKDLWLYEGQEPFSLGRFVREALYVPDSRSAERVLDDLRRTRAYMAVVLDEYGGTAGIITVEDLVEEVMGDITDEYDLAARTSLEMNGVLELAGSLSLIDARSDHGLQIPEGDWTTLGGYVFAQLGRLPRVGDRARFGEGELEVVAMDGRRVAALRVHRTRAEELSNAS